VLRGDGFEDDVVAEGLELGDGALALALGVAPGEVVATQVLVVAVIGEQVLTATVRGAGKAPASVLSTGSLAPRKAELGRALRFSSLVAATSHVGLINKGLRLDGGCDRVRSCLRY
jgi:hypothetical protein